MPSDPKSPKPMPSAAEINAYLEQSAARTRMRLPLAKGNALPTGAAPPVPAATGAEGRELPVRGKALPTSSAATTATPASEPGEAAWTPFSDDSK